MKLHPDREFSPNIYSVALSQEPSCVALARRTLRAALWDWQLDHLADTAQLVISELATNAVLHAGSAEALVYLTSDRDGGYLLAIEVIDDSLDLPKIMEAGPDDEDHRGLVLVDALCTKWGVDLLDTGKVIWAHLAYEALSEEPSPRLTEGATETAPDLQRS